MAKKSKFGVTFDGFDELMKQYDGLSGDLKKITEKCLKATHEIITPKIHDDMKKHKRTGKTEAAIKEDNTVKWNGTVAGIGVGFEFPQGLASVFLMYGTPKMKKDTKLYNDIYGKKTRDTVAQKQKDILNKAIMDRMG